MLSLKETVKAKKEGAKKKKEKTSSSMEESSEFLISDGSKPETDAQLK